MFYYDHKCLQEVLILFQNQKVEEKMSELEMTLQDFIRQTNRSFLRLNSAMIEFKSGMQDFKAEMQAMFMLI